MCIQGVTRKVGPLPGKIVALFGGVHGNERVGVEAVRWAAATIEPERGTIYFVEANPAAIEKNLRMLEKNLNRCLLEENQGTAPEDVRARELMSLLNKCDALLDIHSSNSPNAPSFVICEENGLELAQMLDFPIVSTGWGDAEPGATDAYMNLIGKFGICIECGSTSDTEKDLPRAQKSILQFLEYFGVVAGTTAPATEPKRHIRVHRAVLKSDKELSFTKDYQDFEILEAGKVFACSGQTEYIAEEGDCIIFPRPKAPPGAEAFLLGREILT